MTWPGDRGGDGRADDHLSDQFLVDGVAPSVIGGEPGGGEPVGSEHYEPPAHRDPPTAPIPAQRHDQRKPGWFGRMFGRNQ